MRFSRPSSCRFRLQRVRVKRRRLTRPVARSRPRRRRGRGAGCHRQGGAARCAGRNQAIGNVEAYTSISVRSQVTGQLQQVLFREGDTVRKGERLFVIDARPFEAAVQQAGGQSAALIGRSSADRSSTRQRRRERRVSAADSRASDRTGRPRIISKDVGEQTRAAADAAMAAGQGRQGGH